MTLIKGPGFPLYLAAIHELGVALALSHQLVYAGACLVAALAVRPLIGSPLATACAVALLYNPVSFGYNAWRADRSQVSDTLALIVIACAIGSAVRARASLRTLLPWLGGLGLAFGAFWITREDGVWLVPATLWLLAVFALRSLRANRLRPLLAGIPIALVACVVALVCAVNGTIYGWPTVTENFSPEFLSAMNALTRIDVPKANRFVPVPRTALRLAYRVSPAAAELAPSFLGPELVWNQFGCAAKLSCDEIAAPWFSWALRDAVNRAGYYRNAASAREFYARLGSELDAACDAGRLPCRAKARGAAPNLDAASLRGSLSTFARVVMPDVIAFRRWGLGRETTSPVSAEIRRNYQLVAGFAGPRDRSFSDASQPLKNLALANLHLCYALFAPVGLFVALVLCTARILRFVLRRRLGAHAVESAASAGLALAVGGLAGLIALVAYTAFPGAVSDEYLAPAYPLLIMLIAFSISAEGVTVSRWLRRRLRRRSAIPASG